MVWECYRASDSSFFATVALRLCHRNALVGLVTVSTSTISLTWQRSHMNPVKFTVCAHDMFWLPVADVVTHIVPELVADVGNPKPPSNSREILVQGCTMEAKCAFLSLLGIVSDRSSLQGGTELPLGQCYGLESHPIRECSVVCTGVQLTRTVLGSNAIETRWSTIHRRVRKNRAIQTVPPPPS